MRPEALAFSARLPQIRWHSFFGSTFMREEWRKARRLVVKIGSALLTDAATGRVRTGWLAALSDDVAALKGEGREVVLVSSGAIALGRRMLGLPRGPLRLEESQAAAAT